MNKYIGFFLMTEKGYQSLAALCKENYREYISFVCIGTDKGIENDFSSEIQELCEQYKIRYCFRKNYSADNYHADVTIAISWRWMLDSRDLIVLHDSILPKYRGFAPLVSALINGESQIGVTALFATDEYDKGDIIFQKTIPINYPIKIAEAIGEISLLYSQIILNIVSNISNNDNLPRIKQNESLATYSLWLNENDYFIDWEKSAEEIKRKVDACSRPYNFAKTIFANRSVNLVEVEIEENVIIENRKSGKVIFLKDGMPSVVCGKGIIKIKEAYFSDTLESILPLNKFRIQFT